MTNKNWFVVMTKPGRQDEAYKKLLSCDEISVFYPKIKQYSIKRKQYLIAPLFPMYLFVNFNIEKHLKMIRYTRGVLRVLGMRDIPLPIADEIVERIKESSDSQGLIEARYRLEDVKKGDKVRIVNGPLEGIEAIVSGLYNDSKRVEILMDLMRIVVDKNHIVKTKKD